MSTFLRQVGKGNSFFDFIEDYCYSEKKSTKNRAIHRLCSLMRKMAAETAIIEELDDSFPEIQEEAAALRTRHDGKIIDIIAFRITFVTESLQNIEQVKNLDNNKYLSSIIIMNFKVDGEWVSYLFRAIVSIPGHSRETKRVPLVNNYIHVYKLFPCEIQYDGKAHKFEINGTFFCQQNSATSVCGHAALCMAINNLKTFGAGIVTTEHINKSIGADHIKRKFGPKEGLAIDEIRNSLKSFGLKYTEQDFFTSPNFEYNEKVYKYIESGFPVLLIFFTTRDELHVVTALGHTLNTDLWRPEAEVAYTEKYLPSDMISYRPTASWVDHFIIHDDNFGMYECMPVESIKRVTLPKYDPPFRIAYSGASRHSIPIEVAT